MANKFKSGPKKDQTQSISLCNKADVEIFKRVWDSRQPMVEITVKNESDRHAHVTVSEDLSCKDFTIVAPETSTPFDLMGTTKLVFVSVVLDPNGERKEEVFRDHELHLDDDIQPETISEMNVQNKYKHLAKVTVSKDRSSPDFTMVQTGKSIPFVVKGTVYFLSVILDPSGKPIEMCRDHPCSIGRSVIIKEDGTIQLTNAK